MNIAAAISKYRKIATALPAIVQSAHAEAFGRQALKAVALRVLTAEAPPGYEDLIERWLETFTAVNSERTMRFAMGEVPGEESASVMEDDGEITEGDVADWVRAGFDSPQTDNRNGKVLDDTDKDPRSTVKRMIAILLGPSADPKKPRREGVRDRRSVQDEYLKYIAAFKLAKGSGNWLSAKGPALVTQAWVDYVRAVWPGIYQDKLREAVA